jgi:hypothetical protein
MEVLQPHCCRSSTGLGFSRFARHYYGNLMLISSGQATEMFQFAHRPPVTLCIQVPVSRHHSGGVAPLGLLGFIARQPLPPNVSPLAASVIGQKRPGILRVLVLACVLHAGCSWLWPAPPKGAASRPASRQACSGLVWFGLVDIAWVVGWLTPSGCGPPASGPRRVGEGRGPSAKLNRSALRLERYAAGDPPHGCAVSLTLTPGEWKARTAYARGGVLYRPGSRDLVARSQSSLERR